jgi:hypothetical protein
MYPCPECGQPTNGTVAQDGMYWEVCTMCLDELLNADVEDLEYRQAQDPGTMA